MPIRWTVRRLLASVVVLTLALSLAASTTDRPPPAQAMAPQVLVVGDSLAVGMEDFLGSLLRYRQVTWEAKSGRTTPQGVQALRAGLREVVPQTVVVSLGTNDGPDPGRFADRIRRVLALVPPNACVVWATLYRPPRKGPFVALNSVLREAARNDDRMTLVNWDHAVERGRVVLPDGLHPDAAGFLYRSRMIAAAVHRGCPPAALTRAPS